MRPLSFKYVAPSVLGIVLAAAACTQSASGSSSSESNVTSVDNTAVKEQTVGNCWLYATAGWVESLHEGATGQVIDVSESYWTYWSWYEKITQSPLANGSFENASDGSSGIEIQPGGSWGTAAELILRYGWMLERDFTAGAGQDPNGLSPDVAANNYIRTSLNSGALKDPASRTNPTIVRQELNNAWKLSAAMTAELDHVFGAASVQVAPTLISTAAVTGTHIATSEQLMVLGSDGTTTVRLREVIGDNAPGNDVSYGVRVGPEAWSDTQYVWNHDDAGNARQKAIFKNVLATLNKRLAVPLAWFVVGNPANGIYDQGQATPDAIQKGDGHESLIVNYQAENVPGFGTLPVNVIEERPAALEAALSDQTIIPFVRIKNSWGTQPFWTAEELRQYGYDEAGVGSLNSNFLAGQPGYNDITTAYANDDIAGSPPWHFMMDVVLPPNLRFPIPDYVAPPTPDAGVDTDAGVTSDAGVASDASVPVGHLPRPPIR